MSKQNLIKESIADAKAITEAAQKRASDMFIQEFSGPLKNLLSDVINENVSTGSDQPLGYNPEEDKDAIVGGKDINDGTGDGPENLQENDSDVSDDENEEEVVEENDELDVEVEDDENEEVPVEENEIDFSDDEKIEDEDEIYEEDNDLDVEDDEDSFEDDEVIEVVDVENDVEDDDEKLNETKKLKATIAKLQKENKIYIRDIKKLREGFDKLNLFNAKLAYAFRLMRKPGVTKEEKRYIAESFDKVKTIREAKLVYDTILKTINQPKKVDKNPLKNKNIKSVISESTQNTQNSRLLELAGFKEEN